MPATSVTGGLALRRISVVSKEFGKYLLSYNLAWFFFWHLAGAQEWEDRPDDFLLQNWDISFLINHACNDTYAPYELS